MTDTAPHALLVPGFHTDEGDIAPMHRARQELETHGMVVDQIDSYGDWGIVRDLFNVSADSRDAAIAVAKWAVAHPDGHVFGHSNGAYIIGLAVTLHGASFSTITIINGAHVRTFRWPLGCAAEIICLYSASDQTVRLARAVKNMPEWITRWLMPQAWGAAGAFGYAPVAGGMSVANYDMEALFGMHDDDAEGVRHSEILNEAELRQRLFTWWMARWGCSP